MDKSLYEFPVTMYGNLEKYNEVLSKARCRIFYRYENRNGTYISDEFAVGDGLTADFMLVADPQEMNACYRLTDFYGNNYWTPVMKTAEAAE